MSVYRNANWLADNGRVKEGDSIVFELTEDLCIGSCLQFKRASKEWAAMKGACLFKLAIDVDPPLRHAIGSYRAAWLGVVSM